MLTPQQVKIFRGMTLRENYDLFELQESRSEKHLADIRAIP